MTVTVTTSLKCPINLNATTWAVMGHYKTKTNTAKTRRPKCSSLIWPMLYVDGYFRNVLLYSVYIISLFKYLKRQMGILQRIDDFFLHRHTLAYHSLCVQPLDLNKYPCHLFKGIDDHLMKFLSHIMRPLTCI